MLISNSSPSPKPQRIAVMASAPYPDLKVEKPDIRYARMIDANMASIRGEMTALYQYLFQSWIVEDIHLELADTLLRISEVEMRHLNIFGKLVHMLGGTPKLSNMTMSGSFPWNGCMINYSKDLKTILLQNISMEQEAVNAYLAQAEQVDDQYLSAMLKRIAQDEHLHCDIFRSFRDRMV